ALVQLARAIEDPALFDTTIAELGRCSDLPGSADPLASDVALRETRLRGLVKTGRARQALTLLAGRPSAPGPSSPPQSSTIETVTVAEVLLAAGDGTTAAPLLTSAIEDAEHHRLPHQIQRAQRAAANGRLGAISGAATESLRRLAVPSTLD